MVPRIFQCINWRGYPHSTKSRTCTDFWSVNKQKKNQTKPQLRGQYRGEDPLLWWCEEKTTVLEPEKPLKREDHDRYFFFHGEVLFNLLGVHKCAFARCWHYKLFWWSGYLRFALKDGVRDHRTKNRTASERFDANPVLMTYIHL